ncbi:hypothetical protein HPB50_001489 [Hyalomma asiaticum]|uniref:Uncharacterized protein n=1 Tax=Hyalomma asiaticum TaxID=266040 RepID=A0ACB7RRD0_HYAAI|nr:hypothetical protein HPB50_001489 [Hyalomma asiaticum]
MCTCLRVASLHGWPTLGVTYFSSQGISSVTTLLDELQKKKIDSYGCLDIITKPGDLEKAVYNIKDPIMALKAKQTEAHRRCVVAFGSTDYSSDNYMTIFKNIFQKVVRDFQIDTIIAITSTRMIESTWANCYAAPPNIYETPKTSRYPQLVCESTSRVLIPGIFTTAAYFVGPSQDKTVAFGDPADTTRRKWVKATTEIGSQLRSRLALLFFDVQLEYRKATCDTPFNAVNSTISIFKS